MSHLSICELSGRSLRNVNAEFELGLHVVLTLDQVGTEEFIPLLDGSTKPRSGTVRIDERCPYGCPEVRRRIGSLWATEYLPRASTIERSLSAMRLSAEVLQSTQAMLETFGVNGDLTRPTDLLDEHSTRLLALAVALCKPDPLALLLAEPFVGAPRSARAVILELITQRAASIPVLVVTASPATAHRLGGACAELGGGFWRRLPPARADLVTVHVAGPSLRALAAEVVRRPRVRALRVTARAEGFDELWLETDDGSGVSLDVVRSAQQLGVRLWSLETHTGLG